MYLCHASVVICAFSNDKFDYKVLRRVGGQQINHEIYLKFLEMMIE